MGNIFFFLAATEIRVAIPVRKQTPAYLLVTHSKYQNCPYTRRAVRRTHVGAFCSQFMHKKKYLLGGGGGSNSRNRTKAVCVGGCTVLVRSYCSTSNSTTVVIVVAVAVTIVVEVVVVVVKVALLVVVSTASINSWYCRPLVPLGRLRRSLVRYPVWVRVFCWRAWAAFVGRAVACAVLLVRVVSNDRMKQQ